MTIPGLISSHAHCQNNVQQDITFTTRSIPLTERFAYSLDNTEKKYTQEYTSPLKQSS